MWRRAWPGVLLVVTACATAPYTGRSQLILVSPEEEARLGAQAFQEVLSESRVTGDPRLTAPVERVGRRIAAAVNRSDLRWRFAVLDDPEQENAFALPGGKVGVYTGLFAVADTTTGLAVVLAHEIAHVLARHGAERMSQGLVARAGGAVLAEITGRDHRVLAAYGLGARYGVLLPYGRTQESEADHIGLVLMAKAGYDPRGAIPFWQRLERAARSGQPPEFFSTHPSHETRIAQIEAWLPEAMRHYDADRRAPDEPLPRIATTRAR